MIRVFRPKVCWKGLIINWRDINEVGVDAIAPGCGVPVAIRGITTYINAATSGACLGRRNRLV
jgi:hypothetical protein